MFCTKCGTKVEDDALFCPKCGEKIISDNDMQKQMPQDAPVMPTSAAEGDTRQTVPDSSAKTGKLEKLEKIGKLIMVIAGVLLFIGSFIRLPISGVVLALAMAVGLVLSSLNIGRPVKLSKIWYLFVGILIIVVFFVANAGKGGDKYIQMVKNGTLGAYPQKTVGEAFDDYLGNPKWESGLSEDGVRFVNVTGTIYVLGNESDLCVQFIIDDEKSGSFSYNACEINGAAQNDFIVLGLLEAIYSDDSEGNILDWGNDESSILGRIDVDETKSFDNSDGNMEVTLEYVEFCEKNTLFTEYAQYPDEGCVFLNAVFSLNNVGEKTGSLFTSWSTVVYDGAYEYKLGYEHGDFTGIAPLTSPKTGILTFTVPKEAAETDNSLVINVGYDGNMLSYIIRAGNGNSEDVVGDNDNKESFPLVVSTDATRLFDEWAAAHPLVGDYHLDLISDDDVDDGGNAIFLFTLETGDLGMFNMSIRKSDGYMEYISKFETMSMDDWYESITGVSGESVHNGDISSDELWEFAGYYSNEAGNLTMFMNLFSSPEGNDFGNMQIYDTASEELYYDGEIYLVGNSYIAETNEGSLMLTFYTDNGNYKVSVFHSGEEFALLDEFTLTIRPYGG